MSVQCLTDAEIEEFVNDLDRNNDGFIDYEEIELKLDQAHNEIAPEAQPHHLHHNDLDDEHRHQFLRNVIGSSTYPISRANLAQAVRGWKVPSLEPDLKVEECNRNYMKSVPLARKLRAYWSVKGPEILFITLVIAMQIAFGVWQMVKYIVETQWRAALGWGVVLSKTSAGACMLQHSLSGNKTDKFSIPNHVFPHSFNVKVYPYFCKTLFRSVALY